MAYVDAATLFSSTHVDFGDTPGYPAGTKAVGFGEVLTSRNTNRITYALALNLDDHEQRLLSHEQRIEDVEDNTLDDAYRAGVLGDPEVGRHITVDGGPVALSGQDTPWLPSFVLRATLEGHRGGIDVESPYMGGSNFGILHRQRLVSLGYTLCDDNAEVTVDYGSHTGWVFTLTLAPHESSYFAQTVSGQLRTGLLPGVDLIEVTTSGGTTLCRVTEVLSETEIGVQRLEGGDPVFPTGPATVNLYRPLSASGPDGTYLASFGRETALTISGNRYLYTDTKTLAVQRVVGVEPVDSFSVDGMGRVEVASPDLGGGGWGDYSLRVGIGPEANSVATTGILSVSTLDEDMHHHLTGATFAGSGTIIAAGTHANGDYLNIGSNPAYAGGSLVLWRNAVDGSIRGIGHVVSINSAFIYYERIRGSSPQVGAVAEVYSTTLIGLTLHRPPQLEYPFTPGQTSKAFSSAITAVAPVSDPDSSALVLKGSATRALLRGFLSGAATTSGTSGDSEVFHVRSDGHLFARDAQLSDVRVTDLTSNGDVKAINVKADNIEGRTIPWPTFPSGFHVPPRQDEYSTPAEVRHMFYLDEIFTPTSDPITDLRTPSNPFAGFQWRANPQTTTLRTTTFTVPIPHFLNPSAIKRVRFPLRWTLSNTTTNPINRTVTVEIRTRPLSNAMEGSSPTSFTLGTYTGVIPATQPSVNQLIAVENLSSFGLIDNNQTGEIHVSLQTVNSSGASAIELHVAAMVMEITYLYRNPLGW